MAKAPALGAGYRGFESHRPESQVLERQGLAFFYYNDFWVMTIYYRSMSYFIRTRKTKNNAGCHENRRALTVDVRGGAKDSMVQAFAGSMGLPCGACDV